MSVFEWAARVWGEQQGLLIYLSNERVCSLASTHQPCHVHHHKPPLNFLRIMNNAKTHPPEAALVKKHLFFFKKKKASGGEEGWHPPLASPA